MTKMTAKKNGNDVIPVWEWLIPEREGYEKKCGSVFCLILFLGP